MTIGKFSRGLQQLNFPQAVKAAVRAAEPGILDKQAEQWLSRGDGRLGGKGKGGFRNGKSFPDYSESTLEMDSTKTPGPYTLKKTGSLIQGLYIKSIDDKGFVIESKSETRELLLENMADFFLGINDYYRGETPGGPSVGKGLVLPELKKEINGRTGLKLFE